MGQITLPDDTLRKLREIAAREDKSVEELLADVADKLAREDKGSKASLEAMAGIFDDDIPDLSTTIRETMNSFYQTKK